MSHLTLLAAGLGGARFVAGLVDVRPEEEIQVLVNVGDDTRLCGLHCSPDIDLILHTLAGELDPFDAGSRTGGTFECFEVLGRLGVPLGRPVSDRDLATHLVRTSILGSGIALDVATEQLADKFGVGVSLMPVTNDPIRTTVHTGSDGSMTSPEYRVRAHEVSAIVSTTYEGASTSRPSEGAIESILGAERVIIAPGHPEFGIGSILAVPDIRNALTRTRASVVAVSPFVGSQPARGDRRGGGDGSAGVIQPVLRFAESLNGSVDSLVIHTTDLPLLDAIRATGIDAWVDNILMNNREDAAGLAGRVAYADRLVARKR